MFPVYFYVYLMMMIYFVTGASGSCHIHAQTLPTPMYSHMGIFSAAKNAVYLFGGIKGTSWDKRVHLDKVYKWDLNDPSSWFVEIGKTPRSEWFYSFGKNVVVVNDKVFFIGVDHDKQQDGKIFVFDLNTESFSSEQKTPMPHPATFGCLTTNATHIFMVDGDDSSNDERFPIIQVYDIAADEWQSRELDAGPWMANEGWRGQYCSLVGDALYVLGGCINRPPEWTVIDSVYRIDTQTLEIEQLDAQLPSSHAYGVSIYDDEHNLYLFGAYPTYQQDIVAFDFDSLSVSTAFQSQQLYSSAPVLAVNGSIYRFGGCQEESEHSCNALDQVEICELPTESPTQAPTKQPTSPPTHIPTSIPSPSPTKIPTVMPSAIPTHDPTLEPTTPPSNAPSKDPSQSPTDVPTTNPSLMPTHTGDSSRDPTMSRTDQRPPTRPSPPASSHEYGVETTIKIDAVLPQNETDELIAVLYAYAQNAANFTSCSERIDVSSQPVTEEDKTVIYMLIVTCSEATEQQLLDMFDEHVLEYEIVNPIVTHADLEENPEIEIEIEGIYHDSARTVPAHSEKKKHWYLWYLVLLGVLLFVVGVAAFALWFCWRRKRNQRKDTAGDESGAAELQQCGSTNETDMSNATGENKANYVHQGTKTSDVVAESAEMGAIHSFNTRQASIVAMTVAVNKDDDEDEDDEDDDMFGTYHGTTDAGLPNVQNVER